MKCTCLFSLVCLLPLLSSCSRSAPPGPAKRSEAVAVITLDWLDEEVAAGRLASIRIDGPLFTEKPHVAVVASSDRRQTDGKDYLTVSAYRGDGAKELSTKARILECCAASLRPSQNVYDIRLSCKVPCRFVIENFVDGQLRNEASGKVVSPPYLFEPGEYHLRAMTSLPANAEKK